MFYFSFDHHHLKLYFLETVSSRVNPRRLLVFWANALPAVKEVVVTPAEVGAVVMEVGAEEGVPVTEVGAAVVPFSLPLPKSSIGNVNIV